MTLSADIANAPTGSPEYAWEMGGGGWTTLATTATASYLAAAPESVSFRVTVIYGSGESATSNPVTIAFVAATPPALTGLTATPGNGRVSLSWTDPGDSTITKYQIRISADGGTNWSAWTDISGSGATTTSHSVTGLTSGTSYTFELRAVAGSANGASASASATPVAPTQPDVTGVAVTSTPVSGDTYGLGETIRVTLTFSEAVDVTGAPRLNIDMDPAHWGTKWAAYEGGSGTTSLTFVHDVVQPNISTRGIAVLEDTLELNGGAIKSAATETDADLSHVGLGHDAKHKVDWRS